MDHVKGLRCVLCGGEYGVKGVGAAPARKTPNGHF